MHYFYSLAAPTTKLDPNLPVAPPSTFNLRNETLQKLLTQTEYNNSSQSNDQKQSIKIAFAEGYIAANKPGPTRKLFEVSIRC